MTNETMTGATYLHTIPTGEEVTYEVMPYRLDDRCIVVSYPADVDLSSYRANDAYPCAAIAGDWGPFIRVEDHGTDCRISWEVWQIRY